MKTINTGIVVLVCSLGALFTTTSARANTGPAISADLVTALTADGDLSDWPQGIEVQSLPHFDFEVSPQRPEKFDASGDFRVGYQADSGHLFVALQVTDDVFVTERSRRPLPNGLGTNPDGALLYLDLNNLSRFSENIELSYVSRPIAAADQALLPEGVVVIARKITENSITYEWDIDLPALFRHLRIPYATAADLTEVIGFDVLYFDRDTEDDGAIIKWTFGPNDGEDNRLLGDLYVSNSKQSLYRVGGKVAWSDSKDRPPLYAYFQRQAEPGFVVPAATHPNGDFHVKLPPGRYLAYASDQRTVTRLGQRQEVIVKDHSVQLGSPLVTEHPKMAIHSLIPEMMAEQGVRALGMAVVDKGQISELRNFGVDSHGKPVSKNTLYRVASITKPITTMTVLSRADAGLWPLDQPLAGYWVDPDIATDPRHKGITSRHVLRHLTGFPNWRGQNGLDFLYEPGKRQSYSGEGFEYLRRALTAQSGQALDQLAAQIVFAPAGMQDTSFRWQSGFEPRFAGEYFASGKAVNHYRGDAVNAAANLLSTPADIARFAIWCMQPGRLSKDLYADMITPNGDELFDPSDGYMARHGLGWLVHENNNLLMLEHSGGQWGIRTHLIMVPERQQALVVFTNSSAGWPLIRAVFDRTLNKEGDLDHFRDSLYPLGER